MQVWKPCQNNFAKLKFTSAQKPKVMKNPVDFQHFDFCPNSCLEKKKAGFKKNAVVQFFLLKRLTWSETF